LEIILRQFGNIWVRRFTGRESDGLGTLSMTFSTFSGLELSEAEGPAFDSKKELIFLCIVVQSLSFTTQ
jgi:hypothetical protein